LREENLYKSFSRSPSPDRHDEDEEDQVEEQSYVDERSLSPTKIEKVINPDNILKNEVYMLLLKGQN
jgi:hypothetical protein